MPSKGHPRGKILDATILRKNAPISPLHATDLPSDRIAARDPCGRRSPHERPPDLCRRSATRTGMLWKVAYPFAKHRPVGFARSSVPSALCPGTTCGASRYTLLTGRYGAPRNDALFLRADAIRKANDRETDQDDGLVTPSMPEWFRQRGYTTVSVGKVSHHPGGRGGANWDDSTIPEMPGAWDRHLLPAGAWQHPRGWMHGWRWRDPRRSGKDGRDAKRRRT